MPHESDRVLNVKDKLCQLVLVWLLGYSVLVAKDSYRCYMIRQEEVPEQFEAGVQPTLEDLKIMAAAAIIISIVRAFLYTNVLLPLAVLALERTNKPSRKWSKELRAEKEYKWATSVFKLLYMIFASAGGYYLLKEEEWFIASLGGKGGPGVASHANDSPITPNLRYFYMIEMGYAVHSLGLHLYTTPTNDFWEMLLHHVATVLLELFSYIAGMYRIGCLVLFVHDLPDVFVYFTKACVDGAGTFLMLSGYLGMVSSWGFLRLYIYPKDVISGAFDMYMSPECMGKHGCNDRPTFFLVFMLCILYVLHWWWYYLFFKIIMHYGKTGKGHDLVAKTKIDELEVKQETEELKKKK